MNSVKKGSKQREKISVLEEVMYAWIKRARRV
jgi:hypothetical protein